MADIVYIDEPIEGASGSMSSDEEPIEGASGSMSSDEEVMGVSVSSAPEADAHQLVVMRRTQSRRSSYSEHFRERLMTAMDTNSRPGWLVGCMYVDIIGKKFEGYLRIHSGKDS